MNDNTGSDERDGRRDAVVAADDTGMVHAQEILVVEEMDGAMPLTGNLQPADDRA